MLVSINPKLPMRNKAVTRDYYINFLGFNEFGTTDYPEYLMVEKDNIQIHFFLFKGLDTLENYGQLYIRTNQTDTVYRLLSKNKVPIHPNGKLEVKPWGQKEFSLVDPDSNLLTFGQTFP
ncbi:bleomycin resistance protein [Maribacter sp. ACAM166]|uniref:bleomycin resistance protein n=1 Tax=Maribacter sp. ACAM166 TaxID=2508996 RepID=UPI0010FE08E9|nr:VOC family protein [Maribacter sp. ACAM166]TLP80727.1 VOC family protein [Maribacter sp. ACAM166]